MCFMGVCLGTSCKHRSITTAAPVSTSSTAASSLATQQTALGNCPALAAVSRHILPKAANVASVAEQMPGERCWSQSQREELQPQEGSCCLSVPCSGQGPPMLGHWFYTLFLAYMEPLETKNYMGDPKPTLQTPRAKADKLPHHQ